MEGDIIYSYTREQAVEDGVLIRLSTEVRHEYGLKVDTVLTAALHGTLEAATPPESYAGRLHDVLSVFRLVAAFANGPSVTFPVLFGSEVLRVHVVIDGDGLTLGFPEDF